MPAALVFLMQDIEPITAPVNELPLGGGTLNMLWQLTVLFGATIFVLLLAYYSIRLLGGARNVRRNGNISVVEAAGVGFQNNVALVRAGEQYFLIGVSRGRVTLIGEVDAESVNDGAAGLNQSQTLPFESHLRKIFKKDTENDVDASKDDE